MPTDAHSRGCARCDRVPTKARVKMMASGQSRAGLCKQHGRLHLHSASALANGWFDSSGRHNSAGQTMDEYIDTLIIENVKGIRREVQTLRGEMHSAFQDVKHRRAGIETTVVAAKQESADIRGDYVRQRVSLDNLLERIQRLEKRRELT